MGLLSMFGPKEMTPVDAMRAQRDRLYSNVETHRPGDAADAYAQDDFMRQAFAASKNYDQYRKLMRAGMHPQLQTRDEDPDDQTMLSKQEYDLLRTHPEIMQKYMQNGIRNDIADVNAQQWGADWEQQANQDPYRQKNAMLRAKMLQAALSGN